MAIYKPGSTPPSSQVIHGILYQQPNAQTAKLQLANNNRSGQQVGALAGLTGSSPIFKNLDPVITGLDGQFDALTNQADWDAYNANISGNWVLCANCVLPNTGKKLYRQYNFYRMILGLPQESTPLDYFDTADGDLTIVQWEHDDLGTTDRISVEASPSTGGFVGVYQLGAGLGNVLINWPLPCAGDYAPGSAIYETAQPMIKAVVPDPGPGGTTSIEVEVCCCSPTGGPGNKATSILYNIHL